MRLTFLGHAGVRIDTADTTLVCDPWFSPRGAFLAGWHQLPANHHLAGQVADATHVYVSHHHRDHFDADVLASLRPPVTLLLPDFGLPSWQRLVTPLPTARLLADGEVVEVGESLRLRLMHSPTPRHLDSALIIEDTRTGEVVVNLNDCQVDRAQLRDIRTRYPRVDAVLAQFSGATWFPFTYDFPEEERIAAARRKRRNSMGRWYGYLAALRPRVAVAFAGPPIPLDPELTPYFFGADSVFTTPPELRDWLRHEHPELASRCVSPLPGDVLDLRTGRLRPAETAFDWASVGRYAARYAERMAPHVAAELARYPQPRSPLFGAFAAHVEALFSADERTCREVAATVGFEVTGPGGGGWLVDFRELRVREVADLARVDHEYRFGVESRFAAPVLAGRMSWEELFFSFRFRAWRPSVADYNEELMSVLRFSNPADLAHYARQQRARQASPTGYFRLPTARGTFLVGAACPHNGTALSADDYDPERNVIVCPQHGWTYSVPDGACLNGRAVLEIRPLDEGGNQ